jgi:hypothetical protein
MQTFDADAPKPPTYPFITSIFKERGHKTRSTPELLGVSCQPCLQIVAAFAAASFVFRFRPFPRCFRFGEAVFTDGFRGPQEENDRHPMTIFCQHQRLNPLKSPFTAPGAG